MEHFFIDGKNEQRVTFRVLSIPAKALATCIILAMTFGMVGALGQVIVHDIIPTFFSSVTSSNMHSMPAGQGNQLKEMTESGSLSERGDLFSELSAIDTKSKTKLFYQYL